MAEKNDNDSYEKKLQKLREKIERGWNDPDSNSTIENIIASKQIYKNKNN